MIQASACEARTPERAAKIAVNAAKASGASERVKDAASGSIPVDGEVVRRDRHAQRHQVAELPDHRARRPQRSPVGGVAEPEDPQQGERREGRRDADGHRDGGVDGGEEGDDEAMHAPSTLTGLRAELPAATAPGRVRSPRLSIPARLRAANVIRGGHS